MNKGAIIKGIEKEFFKKERIPRFAPGDLIKVYLKIKEGEKERIQIFEGTVIARKGEGIREVFKVRRIASGVGVERTFILNSPNVSQIQVVKRGDVTRAKLYYLRGKTGKHARIKQMRRDKMMQLQADEQKAIEAEQVSSALEAAQTIAPVDAEITAKNTAKKQ